MRNPSSPKPRTIAALLLALASVPAAGSQARGQTAQIVAPPAAPAQHSARHADAHADRVLLVPTAETHPAGTLFLSSYEIIVPSVGYAVTDRMQISLTGLTDFDTAFVELNVKANLLRSRFVRVAALSSIDYARGASDGELLFGRAGASVQLCFELACATSLSLSAMLVAHDELDTILPLGLGAGFTAQVAEGVSALIEYTALVNAAREFEFIDLPVYLVGYGVRIAPRASWALDLAFIREMASDEGIRTAGTTLFDVVGIPFLAFSYRFTSTT